MSTPQNSSLAGRIDALSQRERIMILGVLILIPWVVAFKIILRPLLIERIQTIENTSVLSKSILDLTTRLERLKGTRTDPLTQENVRLGGYRKELEALENDVSKAMKKLVAPQEMTIALGTLLRNSPGITLTELRNMPVQPIVIHSKKDHASPPIEKGTLPTDAGKSRDTTKNTDKSKTAATPDKGEEKPPEAPPLIIWRHTIKLSFTGDYLSTMTLLQSLRNMAWTFYWDTLDLQIKNHPQAQVTLIIFTLSLEEELIGA
ncbi:MAG: hypothetical protein HQL65_12005 [Magnetococcales bacterium]|nr:hypothetical protein [Magnetococcales bacterium]